MPVTSHWLLLPHVGESPAQSQFMEGEVHPNDASQFSLPGLMLEQSTGGGLEQSPGTTQLTGAQEAEPHPHRRTAQYSRRCDWEQCVTETNFSRPQEFERHIREVHGLAPKCPFCLRPCRRAYLMRDHLIDDHRENLTEDVFQRLLVLQGKKLFAFVNAIWPPQS